MPGIILLGGAFIFGARYYQEIPPKAKALDRAEHVDMRLKITVPAWTFENCVKIEETTPVDKQEPSVKQYCHGVGLATYGNRDLVHIDH